MIDPVVDQLRPLPEVIKSRLGRRISPATLWRWRLKGVNGVKLECLRVGGCWFTTDAAFTEFLRAQTANALAACTGSAAADVPAERSPEKVRRLKAAGLL
jgi:hypothetical protein